MIVDWAEIDLLISQYCQYLSLTMSEGILVRACYAIVFDNVNALKHILSNRNIIGCYGYYLCKLAARRGAYNCFVYLYELCGGTLIAKYLVFHILVSMNIDIFIYVENDVKYLSKWDISVYYGYAKLLDRKDFIAHIEDKYRRNNTWKDPFNPIFVLADDDILWKRIDVLIDCWNMDNETYENGVQWMPREILEDVVFQMIDSCSECYLSNAVGIL